MGLFKGMKDMKDTVAAAPDLIDQAQQMQAQAAQMQAAQAGAMGAVAGMQQGAAAVDPAMLEPIDGISLERYAQLSKSFGSRKLTTEAQINDFLASAGHTPEQWHAAYEGWNARMKQDMALSGHFSALFNATEPL
jgi:hypothetical protein